MRLNRVFGPRKRSQRPQPRRDQFGRFRDAPRDWQCCPCAGQPWLQSPASSGSWGTVAVLLSCTRKDDQFRSGLIMAGHSGRCRIIEVHGGASAARSCRSRVLSISSVPSRISSRPPGREWPIHPCHAPRRRELARLPYQRCLRFCDEYSNHAMYRDGTDEGARSHQIGAGVDAL